MTTIKNRLPTEIRTERLVLVTPNMAHAPAIAALANNQNVHRWMARLPFPYLLSDAHFFLEKVVPSEEEACFAILHEGKFIGVVGLHFAEPEAPELGYWLGEPYWGAGFATEAAMALVEAARAAGAPALRSRALADNTGSRRVLLKAGFTITGTGLETANNLQGREMVFLHQDLSR